MTDQRVRYARNGSVRLAYREFGEGDTTLLWNPGWFSNVDLLDEPASPVAAFIEQLAEATRVIVWDKRGTGLSDPAAHVPPLDERMDDLRAVLDAAQLDRPALFGMSEGGPMSLLFAATYPERASALVIYGSYARHPALSQEGRWNERRALMDRAWGSGEYLLKFFTPGMANDEATRRRLGRFERQSASPAAAMAILAMNREIDTRDILPTIRLPTLVMHRIGDVATSVEAGRYLGRHIPGARYVELPGENHIPVFEPDILDRIANETEEFLTGYRAGAELDRVLATVMFTDIVDSTKRAAALGDRMWRATLDRHDEIVRQQLARFRGREVKHTGDGFLATFDGPARAVRCAGAIADTVQPLGIAVRGGLHTGEIELKGDDIGGIAVNIAARVAAMAGPGETLVSSTVRDLVAGSGLRFDDRGRHALKGLPEDVQLYAALGRA